MAERTVILLLLCVFGTFTVHAQFTVFRGTNVSVLQNLTGLERLAIAAKRGETHILELTNDVQAAVVQELVTINIDCLPWLLQNPDGSVIRWSFIQLDEFGNVASMYLIKFPANSWITGCLHVISTGDLTMRKVNCCTVYYRAFLLLKVYLLSGIVTSRCRAKSSTVCN